MGDSRATGQGGDRLRRATRTVRSEPGFLSRAFAGGFRRILDRIDDGLVTGAIEATLPDGTERVLGGRAEGFVCQVTLHDWHALLRLATAGSQGWYQAWEAGEWSSPDPVPLFALFMANAATLGGTARAKGPWRLAARALHGLNRNSRDRARKNITAHYDLGNAFYAAWLDPTLSYSSARFDTVRLRGPARLEAGQRRKWETLSERLGAAQRVLEIGCGWGGLADHLAREGREVVAISLSDEQLAYARDHHAPEIDFRHQDYRDVDGTFDGIVSVEMVEAVGREYWADWFDCLARNLAPGGRAAIQYIAMRDELFDAYAASADFIQAYIFPGGMLVHEREFRRLAAQRGLSWQDPTDFPIDYADTLACWRSNFDAAYEAGELPAEFDHRFAALWRYYLMYCEGGFRGGGLTVSQVTLVREG